MNILNSKKINQIKTTQWNVDLIGVVKYFRPPSLIQKTGHYQMFVTIIDESVEEHIEDGMRCNLFANEKDLPAITKVGDIVLLKRVKVTNYQGRLQVQKTPHYEWTVFQTERRSSGEYSVKTTKSSRPPHSITSFEKLRLSELLDFLVRVRPKIDASECTGASDKITLLSDAKIGTYINVLVQIVAIGEFVDAASTALLLKVSDGCKLSYNSLYQAGKCFVTANTVMNEVHEFSSYISVFDEHVDDVKKMQVGDVVLITNLHVKGPSKELVKICKEKCHVPQIDEFTAWRELIVHSGKKYSRGLKVVNDERATSIRCKVEEMVNICAVKKAMDDILKMVDQRELDVMTVKPAKRCRSGGEDTCANKELAIFLDGPLCTEKFLTTTNLPQLRPSTISEMKSCDERGKKWRLHCKAVSIRPKILIDMIEGFCEECRLISKPVQLLKLDSVACFHCPNKSPLKFNYLFRLLLMDGTGLAEVISFGDESLYFFNNIAPVSLMGEKEEFMSDIQSKLDKFDNYKNELPDVLPSVDVCVSSRLIHDKFEYFLLSTSII